MFELFIESRAERDLKRLPAEVFARVVEAIQGLRDNPRPPGCRKLTGAERDWRIRVGDYRVVYEIDSQARAVRITRVRHRREVYR